MLRRFSGLLAFVLTVASGCRSTGWDPCFRPGHDTSVQLAPSGRAAAFIHPAHYHALAGGQRVTSLECMSAEALTLFTRVPDTLIVVLDCDHPLVRFKRVAIELGYDPLNVPKPLPAALSAAADEIDDGPAPEPTAFHHLAVPLAEGIGGAASAPRSPRGLHGYVYLPWRQDLAGGRFLHEFAHNWGARIAGPPALAQQIARFHGHWGFSSVGGVLGGWAPGSRVELDPEHHYRANAAPAGKQAPVAPFAPLELYLMGLIGASEVPAFEVAVEPVRVIATEPLVDFTAAGLEIVTIDDIIIANGPRIPAHPDAPKHFEIGLVILAGAALNAEEWTFYERSMDFMSARDARRVEDEFASDQFRAERALWRATERAADGALLNFFAATGERASLDFSPPSAHAATR